MINGHLYVAGGRDATNTVINTLYNYDIAADSWTTGANLPAANNVPGSGVINGQLFIMGGGNPFSQTGSSYQGKQASKAAFLTKANTKGALPQTSNSDGLLRSRHRHLDEWQQPAADGIVPRWDQRR